MISVIIPAHNEAAVIGRSLCAILSGVRHNELEIIVVCNGCSDNTAVVARGTAGPITVLETPVASKVHAMNLGDQVARGFPRFYVDADVCLAGSDLLRLAGRLERGDILAVAPRFRMNLAGCSWGVRAFYAINDRLPSSREGIGGSGVYGLSKAGRGRFGAFPDVIADDAFVRIQFSPQERESVDGCFSTVFAPRQLGGLIRIKTRSHLGSLEVRREFPQKWCNRGATNKRALQKMVRTVWMWPALAAYAYVKIMARWRAQRSLKANTRSGWERDDTSRSLVPSR